MKALYDFSSQNISKIITNNYSTSFSLGIKLFEPSIRPDIYAIYGFVRLADEIVDSFNDYDQKKLFNNFEKDYHESLKDRISLNPVLNSFQFVVRKYKLEELVDHFLNSMKMDLYITNYASEEEYKKYIFGSAESVGLMCLKVFLKDDKKKYEDLKPYALALGSAFQKVNFLRDIKDDYQVLGRSYFPNVEIGKLNQSSKEDIIREIKQEFDLAYLGIIQLPLECRMGVLVAYRYYLALLKKLEHKNVNEILISRTRISNGYKMVVLLNSYLKFKLNII